MKGRFITFEGAEGSGKSTQAKKVLDYLRKKNLDVMLLREPGGVAISESIRKILLDVKNSAMTNECETLLYMAARAQIVEEVIIPEIKKGTIILCDRFLDSTLVYQGYGNGVELNFIRHVGSVVTQDVVPHLTFLFDLPAEKGLSRTGVHKDRIELRSLAYHKRVRQGYLTLAKEEPNRIRVIDANRSKSEINEDVRKYINELLGLT